MFGLVRKKALIRYMKEIKDENRASNIYAKYPPKDNKQEKLNCYSQGYEDGTDNFYNVMVDIIRKHMNDGWIPVEERLPEVPDDMEDEYCPEFNVTIKGASRATTLKYSPDGAWFDDSGQVRTALYHLNQIASLLGFEIVAVKDKRTGKEYRH